MPLVYMKYDGTRHRGVPPEQEDLMPDPTTGPSS